MSNPPRIRVRIYSNDPLILALPHIVELAGNLILAFRAGSLRAALAAAAPPLIGLALALALRGSGGEK